MNMPTSNLENYKVDHLFLLVGENPLPNYVSARLLRSSKTTLHLVHSTNTASIADRLKTVLGGRVETVSLKDRQADGFYVYKEILNHLEALKKHGEPNGTVGLNYTGGTKAMAVHAYRCLINWQRKQDIPHPIVFSYLDPYQLKLCIDDHENQCVREIMVGTALNPPPDLRTVLQLHGLEWKREPDLQPTLPELATALAQLGNQDMNNLKTWSYQNFGAETAPTRKPGSRESDDNWKDETTLTSCNLPLSEKLRSLFSQSLYVSDVGLDLGRSCDKAKLQNCSKLCDWLAGTWLEHYVMSLVLELQKSYGLNDVARSLKIKDPKKNRYRPQFEFDVVFLRGYQLFGISCTTSKVNETCKLKLFEAYSRAQQLGGDEVRIALVSTHEYPDSLRQELNLVRDDPKVLVIGKDSLWQLKTKLEDWICITSKIPKQR
jgi:Domain of unknown function (DUF1887)